MKKSKIIIPALGMLVLSSAATVTGTVAWFTMNTTAKAEGMVIAAKTSGSLIIKIADLENPELPTTADKGTKVTFADSAQAFYPSTHDLEASATTGLKYVSNGDKVNFETGTRMNQTTTLTYGNVAADDSNYYHDYAVYLAGDGMALPDKTLTISLDGNAVTDINGAVSIDFYGASLDSDSIPQVNTSNYLGTLNLAKKYNDTAYSSAAKLNLTPANITIPQSDDDDPVAYGILMRAYYDGALIQAGVSNNDYAVYTECGESEQAVANLLYYSDANGSAIVPRNVGQSVKNLYKVNTSASTTCYARSIQFANVSQQTINVTFTI